jgi:hypothetical protein
MRRELFSCKFNTVRQLLLQEAMQRGMLLLLPQVLGVEDPPELVLFTTAKARLLQPDNHSTDAGTQPAANSTVTAYFAHCGQHGAADPLSKALQAVTGPPAVH